MSKYPWIGLLYLSSLEHVDACGHNGHWHLNRMKIWNQPSSKSSSCLIAILFGQIIKFEFHQTKNGCCENIIPRVFLIYIYRLRLVHLKSTCCHLATIHLMPIVEVLSSMSMADRVPLALEILTLVFCQIWNTDDGATLQHISPPLSRVPHHSPIAIWLWLHIYILTNVWIDCHAPHDSW